MKDFESILVSAKLRLLQLHYEANVGHLGGNLSCFDSMMALHHLVMADGDKFVLSKGHAACALYTTLWSLDLLTERELKSFGEDGSKLAGHPSGDSIPGVYFPTGSLGHGLSLACGLALRVKHKEEGSRVFCLMSDGEWQEGSSWEALTFAHHHKLFNLSVIIDQNGLQGFGRTEDVISTPDLTDRIRGFGVKTTKINGHDTAQVTETLCSSPSNGPHFVVLETTKGKDTHLEGTVDSHYLPMNFEEYDKTCKKIRGEM
jgi:transketolase